jgi:hypothetical protein
VRLAGDAAAGLVHLLDGHCRHAIAHDIGKTNEPLGTVLADPGNRYGNGAYPEKIGHQCRETLFRQQLESLAARMCMDLICYLHPGWAPLVRPAPATRAWMDDTPESFAYRCLPLNIANAHGWEVLSPCAFDAIWNGEAGADAITIRPEPGAKPERVPVSLFGQGVITFHIEGIFRTPEGWNLWVGGSPNRGKDGISPLTGIVETDWSPFTFTMNWRFTRPGQWIHFDALEPVCFLFPVQRAAIEDFAPKFEPLEADPATMERFRSWSRARDEFHQRMTTDAPRTPTDRWQKHYYRGVDASGQSLVKDHRARLRLRRFDSSAAPEVPAAPDDDAPPQKAVRMPTHQDIPAAGDSSEETAALRLALSKREWLLESLERQRDLVPRLTIIERRSGLSAEEFLERYYAVNRPVILTDEMADWPALARWTPGYLKTAVGARPIEYQGERTLNQRFERYKDAHRREAPFDVFIDQIVRPGAGNDAYLTAYNSERNAEALSVLHDDLGFLDKFLDRNVAVPHGMIWIGPAGTVTSLHHDLTNNLIAQIVGRKRVKLAPAAEVGKLYNDQHVFSEISDLEATDIDLMRHPRLAELRLYDVLLEPGEILFMPVGWWHQVKSLDFSVTITSTNFCWRNDFHANYPQG